MIVSHCLRYYFAVKTLIFCFCCSNCVHTHKNAFLRSRHAIVCANHRIVHEFREYLPTNPIANGSHLRVGRRVSAVRAISHATFGANTHWAATSTPSITVARIGKRRMRISGKTRARNTQAGARAHKSTSSYQPTKFVIDIA